MPTPKLQRWIDLLAALLRRHGAASLEELVPDVPAYRGYLARDRRTREAVRRTFERDKDELRAFGVPIGTVRDLSGEVVGYRLSRDGFYLPYLTMLRDGRPTRPRRVDRYGYRSLPDLALEPDELDAVVAAGRRVRALGDPGLAELAASALRKLAFDLPLDVSAAEPVHAAARPAPAVAVLETLDDALRRRKRVAIEYHAMGSDTVSRRIVAPFGLFFLGHHWYLAAREGDAGPLKNFRVSRIRSAQINPARPGTPDYAIPAGFDLREHARSRQAWELGDAAALEAVVEFRGRSGPTMAARRLGEAVDGEPDRRRFLVRRPETFARWLLSFAGEVVPIAPPELVASYRDLARATLAAYGDAGGPGGRG
jgi:proteasome accessory factor B